MIGKTLSHYKILERIGAGGMGVVYRAHDERLGRDVALKLLPAEALGSESARRALENEARTASALNHPHICTIHDVGEAEGQFFVAMEYVEGKPLTHLIPAGGLPEEMVVRYAMQIADALAHAQERGIVHRDLKSANVVVTPEGRAKVLDFGLAHRVRKEELEVVTRSKVSIEASRGIAGTLAYMAPEVLRGEAADARSDIWALGVVLHEMAAGELPFQGATGFELSAAILRESTQALPTHVPSGLRGVIQRCLAKDPAQRYQRAGEVKAALEAIGSSTRLTPLAQAPEPHSTFWRSAIIASAGVLALAAVLLAFNVGGLRERLLGHAGPPRIESIAVLPLANLSGDPNQEYFADGMTEALIAELSKIRALKVISRTSVMQYKGVKKPLPQIARELNVDGVIEGSVLRDGNQLRITVQLIEGKTDQHLWADSYQREMHSILALQSGVAQAIAAEIKVTVSPEEKARLATDRRVSPEAYEAYLKGRHFWELRTREGLEKALGYFEKAVQIDPQYALGYVGLADTYLILGDNGYLPPQDTFPKATVAARKALELDESLGEAHTTQATVLEEYEWDWVGAEREFKRALQLNPGYATTHHWYGEFLTSMGRHAEGITEIKKARTLDPLSPRINANVGRLLYFARRYDEAIQELQKALELSPDHTITHRLLSLAYSEKGLHEKAIAEAQKAIQGGETQGDLNLAKVLARAGRRQEARKIMERVLLSKRYASPVNITYVYAALGETDKALVWLEKAYAERNSDMVYLLEPAFDPLRSDPRFQDLLRRMNFPR